MTDEPFRVAIDRMLTEAYERMGDVFPPPVIDPELIFQGQKVTGFVQLSTELALDAGLLTEDEARAQGWTPPPPPTWRDRLRWRWQAWRERVGRKVGGWIAGVDLSERDEDW